MQRNTLDKSFEQKSPTFFLRFAAAHHFICLLIYIYIYFCIQIFYIYKRSNLIFNIHLYLYL